MKNLISVIVPLHKLIKNFPQVRNQIHTATTPIEIIYVSDIEINLNFMKKKPNEKIVRIKNRGRGYMLSEGARHAQGEIIMFLHSDTFLPKGWDIAIQKAMDNKKIIGGGFNLKFDFENTYLKIVVKIVMSISRIRKTLSGDRAIFLRFEPLKKNLSILEMPIMEDLELSYWMRKHGKIILLKESVITSADKFVKNGLLRQTWKITKCIAWYKLGGNLDEIYNYYYKT